MIFYLCSQEQVQQHANHMVSGLLGLLEFCPQEVAHLRKELLIAARHILATDLRNSENKYMYLVLIRYQCSIIDLIFAWCSSAWKTEYNFLFCPYKYMYMCKLFIKKIVHSIIRWKTKFKLDLEFNTCNIDVWYGCRIWIQLFFYWLKALPINLIVLMIFFLCRVCPVYWQVVRWENTDWIRMDNSWIFTVNTFIIL